MRGKSHSLASPPSTFEKQDPLLNGLAITQLCYLRIRLNPLTSKEMPSRAQINALTRAEYGIPAVGDLVFVFGTRGQVIAFRDMTHANDVL
jgi:hypothetical protein